MFCVLKMWPRWLYNLHSWISNLANWFTLERIVCIFLVPWYLCVYFQFYNICVFIFSVPRWCIPGIVDGIVRRLLCPPPQLPSHTHRVWPKGRYPICNCNSVLTDTHLTQFQTREIKTHKIADRIDET